MKIKDIATLAGVAPSTVSRVINNSGYVSEDVRKKVEGIIKETGYVPNEIAKSLKIKKTNTIGVIIARISSETASKIVEGISKECKEKKYNLILANTGLNIREELNYLKILQTKQIDGLIFMATEITQEHLDILKDLKIPIVIIGQKVKGYHCVIHNDKRACKEITELVIRKKHKRIGYISVDLEDVAVKYNRFEGFQEAMEESDLEIKSKWISYGDFSIESGIKATEHIWTASDIKPTAIIAVNDNMAYGAISYLTEIGVKIPEECAVVGMGNSKFSKYIKPKLTTVEYFNEMVGEISAQDLFYKIDGRKNRNEEDYIPHEIIERDSL